MCCCRCTGRWKATPVAVKIIEHYSSTDGVGSSHGNRLSAGRELLFATSISHPNVVCLRQDAPGRTAVGVVVPLVHAATLKGQCGTVLANHHGPCWHMCVPQVTTFHISTLSEAQRKALAGPAGAAAVGTAAAEEQADSRRLSNLSDSSSNSSSSGAAGREAQLCSTWVVMEVSFCLAALRWELAGSTATNNWDI